MPVTASAATVAVAASAAIQVRFLNETSISGGEAVDLQVVVTAEEDLPVGDRGYLKVVELVVGHAAPELVRDVGGVEGAQGGLAVGLVDGPHDAGTGRGPVAGHHRDGAGV